MINKIFFTTVFLIMSNYAKASDIDYVIGKHRLKVPSQNVVDSSSFHWLKSIVGLDEDVSSFIFTFNTKYVERFIEGYNLNSECANGELSGSVADFSRESIEKFNSPEQYRALWEGTLDYDDREVIRDDVTGYYFVFASKGYRGMFYIFSEDPNTLKELPSSKWDFFIASCSGSSLKEFRNVTCNRQLLKYDDLLINYSFSLHNLKYKKELDFFIINQIDSWKN